VGVLRLMRGAQWLAGSGIATHKLRVRLRRPFRLKVPPINRLSYLLGGRYSPHNLACSCRQKRSVIPAM
jgi:hypothetical protein